METLFKKPIGRTLATSPSELGGNYVCRHLLVEAKETLPLLRNAEQIKEASYILTAEQHHLPRIEEETRQSRNSGECTDVASQGLTQGAHQNQAHNQPLRLQAVFVFPLAH